MNNFSPLRSSAFRRSMLAALVLVASASSHAAVTTSIGVTATVTAACTLTTTSLSFGTTVNAMSTTGTEGTGILSATCTNLAPYTIGLDAGATTGATVSTRQMVNTTTASSANLAYSLSTTLDGADWDLSGGTNVYAGTGNGAAQAITVYGKIAANQITALTGAYTDTVTATINF